jgi:hypothetical protein
MAYFITPNVTADNSAFPLRQAEGKVLGRVRSLVKGSTPRAGVKDYRFFVDPLSSLPPEMGEGPRFGFTGFMSRSGYGFNAFAGEEEALARLQEDLGGSFVTFTPALRNNKFFVLDDLKKEGRTPFMEQDEDYRPVPAFGRQGEPAMEGDINKCRTAYVAHQYFRNQNRHGRHTEHAAQGNRHGRDQECRRDRINERRPHRRDDRKQNQQLPRRSL